MKFEAVGMNEPLMPSKARVDEQLYRYDAVVMEVSLMPSGGNDEELVSKQL